MRQQGWRLGVKRGIDMVGAASGLMLLGPLIGITALAIRASMGSPVFFRQPRPGRGGRPFVLTKFRTMREARSDSGELLPDRERMTKVGTVIRSLSLDELPQLWNVLRGDMSLVGPRPLLMQYMKRYSPRQARRHEVLPGITGWAQVNGRNTLSHDGRFELDVWYVDNWSLMLDARIILQTLSTVLGRSGIASPDHPTMPEFLGSTETPPTRGNATEASSPC